MSGEASATKSPKATGEPMRVSKADRMIFVNPYSRVNVDIPNISLAYAATFFQARVFDFNTEPRLLDGLLEEEAHTLGISVRSLNMTEAQRIADAYRQRYPEATICSVGTGIDILCCYPFRQWEEHLELAEPFSDAYPFPDYERFDSFPMFQQNWQQDRWRYALMTSLGCPFPCLHCMCRNRRWQPRSPENAVQELEAAKDRWGIRSFLILDDCFNVSRRRVKEFCDLVRPLKLRWECANGLRADRFDESLAAALAGAGCTQVSFGIESIDASVLARMKKAETFEQIEAAVHIARSHFRDVNGFFIIGLPGSSYESDRQGLEWAHRVGINSHFSYYVPQGVNLPDDEVFYGDKAEPLSDAYPAEQQQRLYDETARFRPYVPPNKV